MNPQDDPEARIRALEQPLADNARATELGTPQNAAPGNAYTPPPPPPMPPQAQGPYTPPGYGAPWAPPPPPPKSSAGIPWVVLGIIAVIFMAIAAGVGFYISSKSKHQFGSFTMPSISMPSISVPSISVPSISVPSFPSTPSDQPAQPGGNLSVAGIQENKTIACNDSHVSISGVSNTVTITGHCASVDVSGMQNHVTLDTSDQIIASGFNNIVTYHSGNPDIDNSGGSNEVQQG